MALPVRRSGDVTGWSPFRELDDLHGRLSQLLESTFGDRPGLLTSWAPPVDLEETDDAFVVKAELPGAPASSTTG